VDFVVDEEDLEEEEISQLVLLIRFLVQCIFIPLLTVEMGTFMHASEGDMLYESTNTKIPYFNAPIYLENKVSLLKNILTAVITGKSR
jgi:hypothetical protein